MSSKTSSGVKVIGTSASAKVTLEEFQAWQSHPVTEWVARAFQTMAEAQAEEWARVSWKAGACDPLMLTELRTRADAYEAMTGTDYTGFCNTLGETPNTDA